MKEIYTNQNIDEFFKEFKSLPNSFKIEKVHQLLNNPNAKATHKIKSHFNLLKFIIITSALIIGVSALLLWHSPEKTDNYVFSTEKHSVHNEYSTLDKKDEEKSNKTKIYGAAKNIKSKNFYLSNNSEPTKSIDNDLMMDIITNPDTDKYSICEEFCDWPLDTVLDKKSLYIYLSKSELKKLGVSLTQDSMYYYNRSPNKKYKGITSINWRYNKPEPTNFDFHMVYSTDTACTRYRWGHDFYTKVDTLVPVVINIGNENQILWFTPSASFFKSLPIRYQYLEDVFNELKCCKKSNPDHQFTNHWNLSRNIVFDKINYLELDTEHLKKIGFQIFKDSISLVHPTKNMFYNSGKWLSHVGTKNTFEASYPPNPLPVIVTDEKGLKQHYFGHGSENDFIKAMFDILVPIKVSLNKLISTKDYYYIFWFYPTDDFIDSLPEEIKYELKLERNDIINGTNKSEGSCTYFEACKSTLIINDLKVYPNPANQNISIEFSLPQETNGSISLTLISGVQVKSIVSREKFNSGLNSFNANLSDVSSGVYLISIITLNGFKTKRIIISR
jgi:hypothetical protein